MCWITSKGTVQRDFRPPVFHHTNLPGPLPNGLKDFRFLVKISLSYSNFSVSPRRVNLPWVSYEMRWVSLPGVSNCTESISLWYHTAMSHITKFFVQSPRGIIQCWVSLPKVSYCAESISPGYATPGSHSQPRRVNSHFLPFYTGL